MEMLIAVFMVDAIKYLNFIPSASKIFNSVNSIGHF